MSQVNDVEIFFKREMEFARHRARIERHDFRHGYSRGLLRGFLGPCAVHDEWHSRMLAHDASDEYARGYVQGFRAIEQMRGGGSHTDYSRSST